MKTVVAVNGQNSWSGHKPPRVGSLFAAIGGFCKAFEQAGAKVLWANEKDQFACRTFVANFPHIRSLHKPVEDVTVAGDRLEPVDVLTAGFPCQPFSCAGEKLGFSDERGLLFLHIIRLIREFGKNKPKILLLENVQNFRSHDNGRTFKRVQTEIQKAGYWFGERNAQILNTATHTRIPQNRPRIFMVALSCDHFPSNTFVFPSELPAGSLNPVHDYLDLSHKQKARHYFTEASQYFEPFREAIEKGDRKAVYQLRRSYVRQNMSGMCFTLMANMGDGGHNKPVIKDRWGIRNLTPRECARLQGYEDDWFKIPEDLSLSQIYKQIGNSVTIPLVVELAKDDDRVEHPGWYSLLRCSGSSPKEGGEGGSYGIGKSAPFAASRLRTVLYSTRTSKKDVAFQGVARLVTHEQMPGKKAQNVGFLGSSKGKSIRTAEEIPVELRRDERGTDVVILGFITGKDWEKQLRLSVLENFWPAIHFGYLEVNIGDLKINKKNLATLLEQSQKDETSALYYYEAFTSQQAVRDVTVLPHLKKVELYLHTGEAEMPKRVAMVRKSGMVIYHRMFRSAVHYCGVFMCRNETGNALLRAMEPPKHDLWDADLPEKGANKHIEKEFIDYIKESIRNLSVKDDASVISVPELSRFLPNDEEMDTDLGGPDQAHENKVEGFPTKPKTPLDKKEIPVSKIQTRKPTIATKSDDPDDEDEDDGGEEGGGGRGAGGGGGGNGGKSDKSAVSIRFRAFPSTADCSKYSVTVRSDSNVAKKVMLSVQVVGDDTRDFVRLEDARLASGKAVGHAGGKVGPVTLEANKPLRLDLTLQDARKLALEVVAHEA